MIFFYFLKIIFEISALKRSKTYKKLIFNKKNLNFLKHGSAGVFSYLIYLFLLAQMSGRYTRTIAIGNRIERLSCNSFIRAR